MEHTSIVNANEDTVFIEKNILKSVEEKITQDFPEFKFLAEVYINKESTINKSNKDSVCDELYSLITENINPDAKYYEIVCYDSLYFNEITFMRDKKVSIYLNYGVEYANDATKDEILATIKDKEKKMEQYKQKVSKVWLLIECSSEERFGRKFMPDEQVNIDIESDFDRIYLVGFGGEVMTIKD